jgi:hypothetical protein
MSARRRIQRSADAKDQRARDLKAKAYDLLALIQNAQRELEQTNRALEALMKAQKPVPAPPEEKPK